MKRIIILLLSIGASFQLNAFPCYLTMVKDSCWTNYNLNVTAIDPTTNKQITTVSVPQGKSWAREQFNCEPRQVIVFKATFSPVFWKGTENSVYAAQHDWILPAAVAQGDTAWNITLCYPKEFAEVPLPPDASGNCACNTTDIPPIKP